MSSETDHPQRSRRLLTRRATDRVQDPDARARPPRPVPASHWMLPDPRAADEDGVVGVGADLSPATLVDAYRRGIFPWPHPGVPLPWFSPDPRGVVLAGRLHVSRSLRRRLRSCGWTTTVDHAFAAVVDACGAERGAQGTWITAGMRAAYLRLHDLGWAHSLEVWEGDALVAGIYGVQVGATFTGESMFHRRTDASKVALVDLDARLLAAGGRLLDVQLTTDHLRSMGAEDVPRARFLRLLAAGRDLDVRLSLGERAVSRLAEVGSEPSIAP
ncbi:MAG: leucyl/phenylalanyl-tRNA--protein transferase [Nitriliruptoraceae bacterium]|nr:leucyl/phenylalanyl-tRNA--protein transferase [Nitriliruptoraceae bacterium]